MVAPAFPGSRKCPVKVAPAGSVIVSPARAWFKAPCKSPPAATVRLAPSAERAAPTRVKATTPAGRHRLKNDVCTSFRKCCERASWRHQENPPEALAGQEKKP